MTAPEFPFARPDLANTEADLIEALRACARRSVPALQRIYDLTAPRLLAQLLQLLGDREAAESALEECYLQIWQLAGTFNPERSRPGVWLLSIARQQAIDTLHQQQWDTPPEELDAVLQLTHAALLEKPAAQQPVLLQLAYCSGRSPAEIARALGLGMRSVQQELRRALRAMIEVSAP